MNNLTPVEKPMRSYVIFFFLIVVLINSVYISGAFLDKGLSDSFLLFIKHFYFDFDSLIKNFLISIIVPLSITTGVFKKYSWGILIHLAGFIIAIIGFNFLLFSDPEGFVILGLIFMLPFSLVITTIGIIVGRLYFNTDSKLIKTSIWIVLLLAFVILMFNYTMLY